jgi:hypothetical protein
MKTAYLLLSLPLILLTLSCGNKDKDGKKDDVLTSEGILVTDFAPYKDNANTAINTVSLEGNVLSMNVSYSGGCEEHEFTLLGSKMISKSLPPQRGITLYHQNNNDSCRELITEDLAFDISDFAYGEKEIVLILKDWKESISYTLK